MVLIASDSPQLPTGTVAAAFEQLKSHDLVFGPVLGLAINVGSGVATSIRTLAAIIGDRLGVPIDPISRGEFRPGEIRDLVSDLTLAQSFGYAPRVAVDEGIGRYLDWVQRQGDIAEHFGAAERILRDRGIARGVGLPLR